MPPPRHLSQLLLALILPGILCCSSTQTLNPGPWALQHTLPSPDDDDRWPPLWTCDHPDRMPICEAIDEHDIDRARVLCSSLLSDPTTRFSAHRCHAYAEIEFVRRIATLVIDKPNHHDVIDSLEALTLQRQAYEQEHLNAALYHLGEAISVAPGIAALYAHRAEIHFRLNDVGSLAANIRDTARLEPSPETLWKLHAFAFRYIERGETDTAATLLTALLDAAPDYSPALADSGALLINAGLPREALPLLERAIQLNPQDPIPHTSLIQATLFLGDIERAHTYAQAALQSTPLIHALPVIVLALHTSDPAEALSHADTLPPDEAKLARALIKTLDALPKPPTGWAEAAREIALRRDTIALAVALYASSIEPTHADLIFAVSDILRIRGLHDLRVERIGAYLEHLQNTGSVPTGGADLDQVRLFLVSAAVDAKDTVRAYAVLKDVQRQDVVYHFLLGLTHTRAGAADAARTEFEAVIQDPEAGGLKEAAKRELDALEQRILDEQTM